MPHEFAFRAAGPAEGTDADEQVELLATDVDAGHKIFEAGIRAVAQALFDDTVGDIAFKGLDVNEAEIDCAAVDVREIETVIDAWGLDIGAAHAGFVDVVFGVVEATKVVDDADHKFEGIICLEVEALKTLYRKARGVGLAEGVTGKAFDLSPYFRGERFGIPAFAAIAPEFCLQLAEGIG